VDAGTVRAGLDRGGQHLDLIGLAAQLLVG
jgi:hypothetical protein